jgi:hypothetical protein
MELPTYPLTPLVTIDMNSGTLSMSIKCHSLVNHCHHISNIGYRFERMCTPPSHMDESMVSFSIESIVEGLFWQGGVIVFYKFSVFCVARVKLAWPILVRPSLQLWLFYWNSNLFMFSLTCDVGACYWFWPLREKFCWCMLVRFYVRLWSASMSVYGGFFWVHYNLCSLI